MGIQAPAEVKFALIYEAIQQDDNELSISSLCGIAGVSRSGYYAWIKAAPIRQSRDDQDRADFWQETDTWQWMSYVGNFSDSFLTGTRENAVAKYRMWRKFWICTRRENREDFLWPIVPDLIQ